MLEKFICPACGASLFIAAKIAEKTVFCLGSDRSFDILQGEKEHIDPALIYCGSCSWSGPSEATVENMK